ncbi:DNA polymerase IV [Prevotella histicola]|uniref:DNA polymerase IV n=1 Tax=Prevotella histicola TaxID=470565 RepID=A0A930HXX9_9BACT|nr:DNA polymerase IV [Prevotella histicola]MBF1414478.1 DNA polymerase IV [Prevotella histicola]MBW4738938.1 DNA polymerase IV [Prevotella histicola]MBW4747153.1 DNA polymerase IV [Prevotella histicola]
MRKIIHIDMDAFFASVEQRDNPELRGEPIAVGFDGARGVVSTASYEARPYGVHSAMSIVQAKRRCPDLIIVSPHFERYKEVSRQIHEVFHEYTDIIEPISLDEAFLDVTENKMQMAYAKDIANEIKQKIKARTHLTASAGISYNKLLAKIASDMRKPDGMFTVHPCHALDFIGSLPIEKLWGIGPKTAKKMHEMGVFKGEQLRELSRTHLVRVFGKAGNVYYNFARGIDERPVVVHHDRKSVGCERTFLEDLHIESAIVIELYHITLDLVERLSKSGFEGRTLTLKLKWDATTQITRSLTQEKILRKKDDILLLAKRLLAETDYKNRPIRLMGLSVSSPVSEDEAFNKKPIWIEGDLPFVDFM